MASNIKDLNSYETQALIDFFMYTMEWKQRHRLMQELPCVYNKLCDRTIVKTEIVEED